MSTLLSNINSEEFEKENILNNRPGCVHILVEDYDDELFWKDLIEWAVPGIDLDVQVYQQNRGLLTGKSRLLADTSVYGRVYWACVDSDYDFLLDTDSHYHSALACKYVIQTEVYSYENLFCQPETLKNVCIKSTKAQPDFDFVLFCRKLSETLYPLLIWSLYLQTIGDEESFLVSEDWHKVLPNPNTDILYRKTDEELLDIVSTLVMSKVDELKGKYQDRQKDVDDYASRQRDKFDLSVENAYMYVRGHDLFDYLYRVIVKPICDESKNKEREKIRSQAQPQQTGERISCYQNSCRDTRLCLNDNFEYKIFNSHVDSIKKKILMAIA